MKVLAFSDIHLDAVTAGKHRRAEVLRFLEHVGRVANDKNVDLIVFAGDAYDPGGLLGPLYAADITRRFLALLLARGKPALVAVAGNHDVVDASELFGDQPVTTLTPLRVAAETMAFADRERVHVFERPLTRFITKQVAVLGLPYVSRVHAAHVPVWESAAIAAARNYVEKGYKLIVVGHRVVPGAKVGSESVEMARGLDEEFPFAGVAELQPSLVINGHYHAQQVVKCSGVDVYIPGSPVRFTFGEADEVSKGVLIAEV